MFARWRATVFSLITSASATCLFVPPYATCSKDLGLTQRQAPGQLGTSVAAAASRRRSTTASSPVSVRSATSSSPGRGAVVPQRRVRLGQHHPRPSTGVRRLQLLPAADGLAKTGDRLAGIPRGDQHRPTRMGRHGVQTL